MKTILLILTLLLVQETTLEKTMEARAKEMYRVIGLSDKAQWVKFVKENYTQGLIDKPMRQRRDVNGETEEKSTAGTTQEGKINEKAMMFARLHDEFGNSELGGIRTSGETAEMTLNAGELTAVIKLKFDKEKPWLLSSIGVEAHSGN